MPVPRLTISDGFERSAFLIGLILGCLLLTGCFALNRECLLIGIDGAAWIMQLGYQGEMRTPFSGLGVDALQGSFDAYFPVFSEYLLPYAISRLLTGHDPGNIAIYLGYAVIEWAGLFVFGRAMGLSAAQALTTALALPLLTMPVFFGRISRFYPLLDLNPHVAQAIAISILVVTAFWSMGRGPLRTIALAAVPTVGVVLTVAGQAPHLTLLIPAVALYGGASIVGRPLRLIVPQLCSVALLLATCLALGFLEYYRGLVGYSAYSFFAPEFLQLRTNLTSASTVYGTDMAGPIVVGLGLLGAAVAAWTELGCLRRLAIAHLAITIGFQIVALGVYFLIPSYQGPSPVYFETCFWPYSIFFAALACLRLLTGLGRRVDRTLQRPFVETMVPLALTLAIAIIVTTTNGWAIARHVPANGCSGGQLAPLQPTAITEYLRQRIALAPGRGFAGSAATITRNGEGDRPTDWIAAVTSDYRVWSATGNDHRSVGLWKFRIPTLFQYQTFITPIYYSVLTRLLASSDDRQVRSVVLLTRPDPRFLQLWGVRFLITDHEVGFGEERVVLPETEPALRLVELPTPNIGQYSPEVIWRASDVREGLELMAKADFDPRTTAVLTSDTPVEPLTAARGGSLVYEKDGFRLRAESEGESLLVLPVQFSRCWTVPANSSVRLVRVNLAQLGIRFHGSIDALLTFRYSATQSRCRFLDLDEATALGTRDVVRLP